MCMWWNKGDLSFYVHMQRNKGGILLMLCYISRCLLVFVIVLRWGWYFILIIIFESLRFALTWVNDFILHFITCLISIWCFVIKCGFYYLELLVHILKGVVITVFSHILIISFLWFIHYTGYFSSEDQTTCTSSILHRG